MVDDERIHRNLDENRKLTRTTAEKFIAKVRQEAREGRLISQSDGRYRHAGDCGVAY
jgi:hypothetical protein